MTFARIESDGLEEWLAGLREDLRQKTYRPQLVRRVLIPKPGGGERPLGIPTIRDRAWQAQIVSYADDFVILCRRPAEPALSWTQRVLTRLGLVLNEDKTRLCDARRETFDFLGYSFGPIATGRQAAGIWARVRRARVCNGSRHGCAVCWCLAIRVPGRRFATNSTGFWWVGRRTMAMAPATRPTEPWIISCPTVYVISSGADTRCRIGRPDACRSTLLELTPPTACYDVGFRQITD